MIQTKKDKDNTGAGPRQEGKKGHGGLVFDNGVIGVMYAPTHSVAPHTMLRSTKDVYDFAREKAGRCGLLTWRENPISTERFSNVLGRTAQSCHMWVHGCISAPKQYSTASSLNASICWNLFPSKATLFGIVL